MTRCGDGAARSLRIGDPGIDVRLRRSRQARRMVLRIARSGQGPTLTLPPGVSESAALAFLRDQEAWLRARVANLPPTVRVDHGVVLPLRGRCVRVEAGPGPLRLDGDRLVVPGPAGRVPVRVAAFVREEARAACVVGVAGAAARLGRAPGRITLRDPRSRWGSCTAAGDLMFSWRLALAPTEVLDYVVAHEVAHLAELNHSARFWATVSRLCPEFEAPRAWLRRNGPALHAYEFTAG